MENISLPSKIEFQKGKSKHEAKVIIEPCYPGYGTTLGNALRRVLLSSLQGAAVAAVKINGVSHEFSTLTHIKEDVIEIILNLKNLRLKLFSEEPTKLILKVQGEKEVKASRIEPNSNVEIVNPDLHIATLTDKNANLEMEIFVEPGRGYVPTEMRDKERSEIDRIAIDAIFTPIENVGFKIENVRVGQMTNYNKLILDIETDGTITPEQAVKQAAKILIDHFKFIKGEDDDKQTQVEETPQTAKETKQKVEEKTKTEEEIKPKKKRGRPRKIK